MRRAGALRRPPRTATCRLAQHAAPDAFVVGKVETMTIREATQQAVYAAVGAFVDELVRSGVRHFCVCPGSRSTPLALMIAQHPRARLWMHIDERSAAFFGLGMAKMLREPVALVCTSGTAAANFLPAVVEAF